MKPQSPIGIERRAAITKLAGKKKGMQVIALRHLGERAIRHICDYMVKTGELHRIKRNSILVLYFLNSAHARAAYQPGDTLTSNRRIEKSQIAACKVKKPRVNKTFIKPPIPVTTVFEKDAEIVTTAKTVYTLCPAYRPRFEAVDLPFKFAMQSGRCTAGSYESPSAAD